MKTSSLLFACAAASVALLTVSTPTAFVAAAPAATKCDTAVLIEKLLPLLDDDDLPTCQEASGFSFYPFSGLPSEAQLTKLCKNDACQSLLEQMVEAEPPSCELEFQGVTFNVKDTINMLATQCQPPSSQ